MRVYRKRRRLRTARPIGLLGEMVDQTGRLDALMQRLKFRLVANAEENQVLILFDPAPEAIIAPLRRFVGQTGESVTRLHGLL